MDQTTPADQIVLRNLDQRSEDSGIDCDQRYVLVAILKKQLSLEPSLHRILQVLSVSLFEQVPIPELFTEMHYRKDSSDSCNLLTL